MATELGMPVARAHVDQTRVGRDRRRRKVRTGLRYLLLTVLAIIVLFPIYVAVVDSLLTPGQFAYKPPLLFPTHPQWHTYADAWTQGNLGVYLRNSAIVTIAITAGEIVTSVLAGYAFAFLDFPFKRVIFAVFLASLAVPFEVTIVTNYSTIGSLGWYNTFEGLIVPFLAIGFGAFLLRGAFLQLPGDLRDAAALDGFGHWRFMTRVAVPLVRPAIAALGVFAFLSAWNQYLWPLVATGDNDSVRTVQIGLKSLYATNIADINVSFAGTVIALAPLVILLILFQRQLVRGLTAGAVR
jgi:sn-glycerol 3-phosphate transport system permease protein